jgi:hypothetical protein
VHDILTALFAGIVPASVAFLAWLQSKKERKAYRRAADTGGRANYGTLRGHQSGRLRRWANCGNDRWKSGKRGWTNSERDDGADPGVIFTRFVC